MTQMTTKETMNKEQVYDREIAPLLDRIFGICKQHDIPMLVVFGLPTEEEPDLHCASVANVDEMSDDLKEVWELIIS